MNAIVLQASGYTWACPECQQENYTGAAPAGVKCAGCHAEFAVLELKHRVAEESPQKTTPFHRQSPDRAL